MIRVSTSTNSILDVAFVATGSQVGSSERCFQMLKIFDHWAALSVSLALLIGSAVTTCLLHQSGRNPIGIHQGIG